MDAVNLPGIRLKPLSYKSGYIASESTFRLVPPRVELLGFRQLWRGSSFTVKRRHPIGGLGRMFRSRIQDDLVELVTGLDFLVNPIKHFIAINHLSPFLSDTTEKQSTENAGHFANSITFARTGIGDGMMNPVISVNAFSDTG
jgi:hypothetical protein